MSYLTLKIATPEKLNYESTELDSVTIPTEEGEVTILPGHISLVARLKPGELTVRKKGKEDTFVSMGGFLKLDGAGNVVILSDYAVRSEEIEIAKVEEAKKKAEEKMNEKISKEDFILAQLELTRTLLELKVAKKRKTLRVGI